MKRLMKKPVALALGLGMILFANLAVWIGVSWNRSAPESTLQLSERELRHDRYSLYYSEEEGNMDRRSPDNNAIEFKLMINNRYSYKITEEKLEALGFGEYIRDTRNKLDDSGMETPEKSVLLVLELDGPTYQARVEQIRLEVDEARQLVTQSAKQSAKSSLGNEHPQEKLERKEEELKTLLTKESRLYIVDVGLDKTTLRAAYPDTQHYAIVKATMSPSYSYSKGSDGTSTPTITSNVRQVLIDKIYLPRQWHSEPLYKRNAHFTATVNFGQRLEPWISNLEPAQKEYEELPLQ